MLTGNFADNNSMAAICLMIVFISFLGFITENIWLLITKGCINNRNMVLPFLFGYGFFVVSLYFLIGIPQSTMKYYLTTAIFVMLGEIILGSLVEKICHFEWWNYTWIPLHITKYTSIPTTSVFAAIITFFMKRCFAPLMRAFCRVKSVWILRFSVALLGLLIVDMVHSFYMMYKKRGLYTRWEIRVLHEMPSFNIHDYGFRKRK